MPFTLSHAAAVLPLMRRPFAGLALVCGAMAPDIPYYIRATRIPVSAQSWYEPLTNASTSHSAAGLLPVTLPLALLAYLLLLAVAPPLAWLTGADGEARPETGRRRALGWLWVLISLVIGILTHLVWDSATDSGGFLAANLPILNETAFAGLSWVRVLQHASTVLGLVVIAVVVWHRRRSLVIQDPGARRRTLWVLAGIVVVGLIAGVVSVLLTVDLSAPASAESLVENVLARLLTGGGAAVVVVVALAAAAWWVWRALSSRSVPRSSAPELG